MPCKPIPLFVEQQIQRILQIVTCQKDAKHISNSTIDLILQELRLEYARTMNKMIFDEHVKRSNL